MRATVPFFVVFVGVVISESEIYLAIGNLALEMDDRMCDVIQSCVNVKVFFH